MANERPRVGTRLINDAGTCVKIVNYPEGATNYTAGTVPAEMVDALLKAGYRPVTKDDVIPVQAHHLMNEMTDTAEISDDDDTDETDE